MPKCEGGSTPSRSWLSAIGAHTRDRGSLSEWGAGLATRIAGEHRSISSTDLDRHWRLHGLALDADAGAELLLERGLLAAGIGMHRLALAIREEIASLAIDDTVFSETVSVPIELAASHFAIAGAYKCAGAAREALTEEMLAIAYVRTATAAGDPYALETLADHLEEAGRTAREIPDRQTMRELFAECLTLRERAALMAPEDGNLAKTFVECAVWRAPDLGRASADWLSRARRLVSEREGGEHHIPCSLRLKRLIDTAGAPSALA